MTVWTCTPGQHGFTLLSQLLLWLPRTSSAPLSLGPCGAVPHSGEAPENIFWLVEDLIYLSQLSGLVQLHYSVWKINMPALCPARSLLIETSCLHHDNGVKFNLTYSCRKGLWGSPDAQVLGKKNKQNISSVVLTAWWFLYLRAVVYLLLIQRNHISPELCFSVRSLPALLLAFIIFVLTRIMLPCGQLHCAELWARFSEDKKGW